ncbi:MAG TPA: cytochrome oxidase [Aggregicoccus sp.]|nr:cytochrome oxidase [Aggregicoccus sp.]
MSVVVLQVFVSLMLVASSVLLFLVSVRQRDHEHADRLSLIPLEDEQPASSVSPTFAKKEPLS